MKNIDVLKLADEVEMWGEDLLALNMKGGIPVVQGAKMLRQLAEKLECYQRLADASEMASNPMGVKSRVALRNPRVMTKEEEIRKAVEAEREACAKIADEYAKGLERNYSEIIADLIRARSKHD